MRYSNNSYKQKVHSYKCIHQEKRSQINNLIDTSRNYKIKKKTKHKVNRKEEIIKIRAEVSEIETRKTTEEINKISVDSLKR